MTVRSGPSGTGGYDKSLSVTEQITQTQARITSLLSKGREGSVAIQAAREQLANLQKQQTNVQAQVTASKAVLTAHATTNHGMTAAQYPDDHKTE